MVSLEGAPGPTDSALRTASPPQNGQSRASFAPLDAVSEASSSSPVASDGGRKTPSVLGTEGGISGRGSSSSGAGPRIRTPMSMRRPSLMRCEDASHEMSEPSQIKLDPTRVNGSRDTANAFISSQTQCLLKEVIHLMGNTTRDPFAMEQTLRSRFTALEEQAIAQVEKLADTALEATQAAVESQSLEGHGLLISQKNQSKMARDQEMVMTQAKTTVTLQNRETELKVAFISERDGLNTKREWIRVRVRVRVRFRVEVTATTASCDAVG